jgi:hypothetical protein
MDMAVYVHPVVGIVVLVLLVYSASLGFRARASRREAAALLARHARIAPLVYAGMLLVWVGGMMSTVFLRDDIDFAETFHFRIGTVMALLMTASFLTSRMMANGSRTARELHPWLGAGAVLLAAAQAVTGLRITP